MAKAAILCTNKQLQEHPEPKQRGMELGQGQQKVQLTWGGEECQPGAQIQMSSSHLPVAGREMLPKKSLCFRCDGKGLRLKTRAVVPSAPSPTLPLQEGRRDP